MSRSVSPRPRYANLLHARAYSPTAARDHFTPTYSPRPSGSAIADLLHARATGRYSPTAPTYSRTSADVGTSYSPQPTANEEEATEAEPVAKKPTANEEEPQVHEEETDAKKPKAPEPRRILTRAVRSQQKAEKELLQINADIERLNKRKVELTVAGGANKKSRRL